jgi:hypothetical protein
MRCCTEVEGCGRCVPTPDDRLGRTNAKKYNPACRSESILVNAHDKIPLHCKPVVHATSDLTFPLAAAHSARSRTFQPVSIRVGDSGLLHSHRRLPGEITRRTAPGSLGYGELDDRELSELTARFGSFLSLAEKYAPAPRVELTLQLRASGPAFWSELLRSAWNVSSPSDPQGLLAQVFLQPYAERLRSRASVQPFPHAYAICPFCQRKPGFGVLRPMGDGAARSLVCSFCMAEWEFRRIVCPGCGEEDDKKLVVFTANEFPCIRVEGCDSCNTYLKTIDLTKDGYAEPVVDELASAPLDLWAREHGYAKLRSNLLGL